ncbi:30S ribosomal protein S19e [Candidatus Woesearchaeota archaeon]|nr:30S ribosomal protein S19e [Candidatus Woesearchaeota archaeon]
MATIYDCNPSELAEKAAEELKKTEAMKPPQWAQFVKTGAHKERPPVKSDWWYVRAASVLKQVYRYGPIGVSKLRVRYGGKKNRGVKTEHFCKGSGNIIRKILQQLESGGLIKKDLKSQHKGRLITAKGKKFLDDIAKKISTMPEKTQLKKEAKKEEAKAQEPKKETEARQDQNKENIADQPKKKQKETSPAEYKEKIETAETEADKNE